MFKVQTKIVYEEQLEIIEEVETESRVKGRIHGLKMYDEYTYNHSKEVAVLSLLIGKELGMVDIQLKELATCALLHDYGKILVPLKILNKCGGLNENEKSIMRDHPSVGCTLLGNSGDFCIETLNGIYQHHESYSGSEEGYPGMVKGNEISLFGRIIAVADKMSAYQDKRCYHKARSAEETKEYMINNRDLDQCLVKILFNELGKLERQLEAKRA